MEKKRLVSIIIPAFNVDYYVEKTIESILNQTYTNIEIICVDDGSTDQTLQILSDLEAKDTRVKVFSKKNEGVTLARKYGFEQAQGEYIGFVDADDLIEPMMYKKLYDNLIEYNADISHCGHDIVRLNGKRESFYVTGRLAQQDKISGIKSLISGSFEPSLCNKLYRYNLLHNLFNSDVMDCSIKINEDLLMNYYLFKQAQTTVFEDVCLYHYLKREGSASSVAVSSKMIWDQINVKQIILKDSIGSEYEEAARKANLITCLTRYNSLLKANSNEFRDDLEKIRSIVKKYENDLYLLNTKQRSGAKMLIRTPNLYNKLAKSFS